MNVSSQPDGIIVPDWELPPNVHAAVTTRAFGNLAVHVGDDPAAVLLRRRVLQRSLALPTAVTWLQQQHTHRVLHWPFQSAIADAAYSDSPESVCAVLTADCLPILCCSDDGREIAAVHAGWRGLADGVLKSALASFKTPATQIRVWIGPSIGASVFEVGDDVRDAFVARHPSNVEYFLAHSSKWLADLASIAADECLRAGVKNITKSDECTVRNNTRWYSWRKEKAAARFASIIWRN
ncbi:MAG: peptidoglycan editing factor PgeF [Idiomarinaceae bacterium]|uniref:peptidoglycan editing factor PgeF n=1 Tax=Idiomarina sp. 28-8 TaxID=1260624 RepID=UPI0002E77E1E|nr:peptidoglycan editing factor PgeF [Idiomarina sp. 28-8]NWO01334.1 peptidoglycan editing factor PgeF [Idiomarinaceae bacterium]